MAEGKKSFLLYCDIKHTVEHLTDDQAGKLFKHIIAYVNDQNPETEDLVIRLAFEPIKQQLKRDLQRWESERQGRAISGKIGGIKSGESRRSKQTKQVLQNRSNGKQNEANEAVNVNVTVNDTVSEREEVFPIEECLLVAMRDERWVRANKAARSDLEEFNKLLEKRGAYTKGYIDYKNHFANWKLTGKKDDKTFESRSTAPPLQRL